LQEQGKLILTDNLLERIDLYLDSDKFLKAIKYDTSERLTEKRKYPLIAH
jgi:hypothetical protein